MTNKKLGFSLIALFFFIGTMLGQVGLGEINPTAMLEVKTEETGSAAISIRPQLIPLGTAAGQLSVIGDQLYMYDANRSKWLSVESTFLEFGRKGEGSVPKEIEYGGGDVQTGAKMPFDGTIVGISIVSTKVLSNRNILVFVNDIPVPNNDINPSIDGVFDLSPTHLKMRSNDYNLDFKKGEIIKFEVDSDVGPDDIIELILIAQVKWRKDNN